MEMLRATRTRRPARSISISVRLVSSSSSASSRMRAESSLENFAADLSSGWRTMILDPENFLFLLGASVFCFGADVGGNPLDRKPIAVDAEAGKGRERGHGGERMVPETLAG